MRREYEVAQQEQKTQKERHDALTYNNLLFVYCVLM